MEIPEYVTIEEVQRVCREMEISDWTKITDSDITKEEAAKILAAVNTEKMDIPLEYFIKGLEVELEHGVRFKDANVTNNYPLLTAKIVLAHLKETMDYYQRIDVAEIEGDLLHAILARDMDRIESKYTKLIAAQKELSQVVANQFEK